MMEERLKTLFDYQRFEPLPRLERLIRNTESRVKRELTDDEAELVSAAGTKVVPTDIITRVASSPTGAIQNNLAKRGFCDE